MTSTISQGELKRPMARDEKIDILRFIGLAMIILAHTNPSLWIGQLRNFDVPLMVLVSGASFALSYKYEAFTSYFWKRIKRLVFPTWIFLTVYFAFLHLTDYPIPAPDIRKMASSYLLINGIGYVWIIRIFLVVALISPFIFRVNKSIKSHTSFFLIVGTIYVLYEIVLFFSNIYLGEKVREFFQNTILCIIPYAVLFALGLRIPQLNARQMIVFMLLAFAAFLVAGAILWNASGAFVPTQEFKYPPSIYYVSYALAVSILLWLVSDNIVAIIKQLNIYNPVMFIAQNTIWIYLWHIPLIEAINLEFYIKYPIVFALASGIAFLQIYIVKRVIIPKLKNQSNIRNLNYLLTG